MKVLHVIPSISQRSGGPAHAVIPMCRALKQQGIEVLLVTTDADLNEEIINHQIADRHSPIPTIYKEIPTIIFRKEWGNSFKYSRSMASWLDRHVADFDLVHIHAVFNHSCLAAARACRKRGVAYVVRPLGTLDPWSMRQKSWRKSLFWYSVGKTMLTSAAAIHYTAAGEKEGAEKSLSLCRGAVIPLGVDLLALQASPDENTFRESCPSLDAHPYVLVLSRLHSKKGLDVLIEAFLSLVERPEYAMWRLVLAGEGPDDYELSLRRLVAAHGAADTVIFVGWLEGKAKAAALRDAALLALPSYHENFGLCVMEAMACGVPVLVSPHVNLASDIEAAGAGWIVDINKHAIEAALAEGLSSNVERLRRGRAGNKLATEFAWPNIAQRLAHLYACCSTSAIRPQ